MSVGIIILVHGALDRAEQVVRYWTKAGCPVVIHVDRAMPTQEYNNFVSDMSDVKDLRFAPRFRCEWGTWALVAAAQGASEIMLNTFENVQHVVLTSGSCLPLRPAADLTAFLEAQPHTDFIESANVDDVLWPVGGLDRERFTLRFPFSWRRHRRAFDKYVNLQRRVGFQRRIPDGIVPHMGSQWWCLTRQTLSGILNDPERQTFDTYFKRVWIPDESYFQTLARRYSKNLQSQSLTLSKFDHQGRPHIFYDDHLRLLQRSECFIARKIWPRADQLYAAFLSDPVGQISTAQPERAKVDRVFSRATQRRTSGRSGLYMQSCFPRGGYRRGGTATPYSVFEGFSDVFEDFEQWMKRTVEINLHGHLFSPNRVEFANGRTLWDGALSNSAALRDANPQAFLTSLIWNSRRDRQCFQFGPRDNQDISEFIAADPNAQVSVISDAWAVSLFKSDKPFEDILRIAARYRQTEADHLALLTSPRAKANVKVRTLDEFIGSPYSFLQSAISETNMTLARDLAQPPVLVGLKGLGDFLQKLKAHGVHLHSTDNLALTRTTQTRHS